MTRCARSPKTPAGWDVDQLGTDLQTGDVGNLNFLEPDQCDDMHGATITGKVDGTGATGTASDCDGSSKNIYRGDNYTDNLIRKIQASPIWTNPNKRVAIVIMFDEGDGDDRLQLLLRLESRRQAGPHGQRHGAGSAGQGRERQRRHRPDGRAVRQRQQGPRHEHLRRPDEPARRAEGHRRTATPTATSRSCARCRTCSAWPIRATTGRT